MTHFGPGRTLGTVPRRLFSALLHFQLVATVYAVAPVYMYVLTISGDLYCRSWHCTLHPLASMRL